MTYLLGTSGAETLSVSANVFMGQTEAPLIIKPYVAGMTRSELLTMMVGGMAHISGGLMAVYIGMGADKVAILATSVMAAPASLYLSKLFLPETEQPATRGTIQTVVEQHHVNAIDAAAAGASEGLRLALNIAAMLIAFLAFIAMFDYLLRQVWAGLSLRQIFSVAFAPVALLIGVEDADSARLGDLLGTKLVANEFVAYVKFQEYRSLLSLRSQKLATYAPDGLRELRLDRHPAWRHRRHGAFAPPRPGTPWRQGAAGRVSRHAGQCVARRHFPGFAGTGDALTENER